MAKKQQMIETLEEVDQKLLELGTHKVFISKREAEMNSKMQSLRAKFDEETKDERAQVELIEKEIEQYCIINKLKFDRQRTMELTHGSVGFRTNPPKVNQLNKKYTIATTIELVKRIFRGKYIRAKEELDKDAILTDYAAKLITDEQIAGIGLRIDQGEKFFCEPKWEEIEKVA